MAVAATLALAAALLACSPAAAPARVDASGYDATLWPLRPRVQLSFDVAPDLASVTGRESVVFVPDLPTCRLVFRAWPNNPTMAKVGDSLRVTDASVNGEPVAAAPKPAGAPDGAPPTLVELPPGTCLNPGQSVRADLGFRLGLGADADERVGYSPGTRTAWFGSGYPLLSWVRGQGWTEDPAVAMNGETATSEDFELALAVTAPTEYAVAGAGTAGATTPGPRPGTTTHQFQAAAVRDVTVGVGHYAVLDRDLGGVRLHLATPTGGTKAEPAEWADQVQRAVGRLTELLGPFPYPDLWVTVTAGQSDGTEYPGAVQFGDTKAKELPALVAHELAHQWFYALVGNDQARDPWLDEALATYGEAQAGGDADDYRYSDIPDRVVGLMGKPMAFWPANGGFRRYTEAVYNQGGAALLEARRRVGPDRFDQALRAYVAANAHRVATPADFARSFGALPEVIGLLSRAGALAPGQ